MHVWTSKPRETQSCIPTDQRKDPKPRSYNPKTYKGWFAIGFLGSITVRYITMQRNPNQYSCLLCSPLYSTKTNFRYSRILQPKGARPRGGCQRDLPRPLILGFWHLYSCVPVKGLHIFLKILGFRGGLPERLHWLGDAWANYDSKDLSFQWKPSPTLMTLCQLLQKC